MLADTNRPPLRRLNRELQRQRAGAILMALCALVLAALLVPRGDELLLIHIRSRDLDRAHAVLTDRAAAGGPTVSSIVAHGELFLMEGRIGDAVSELEAFVKTEPDNLSAWTRLARLYGDAQRAQDRARATAEVHRLRPTSDTARQLATYWRWSGDDAREAAMLHELVQARDASAQEYVRSARLDAAHGDGPRALRTLEQLKSVDADAFDYPTLELYAVLSVDRDGPVRIGARVQVLPAVVREPALLQQLAAAFDGWGRTDAAAAVFAVPPRSVPSPGLLTMRARAAMGHPVAKTVVDDMVRRDATTALPAEPLTALVDLALSIGDYDAIDRVLGHPQRPVSPAILASVVGYAVSHGARARAQAIVGRLGDDVLTESPILALELAVERGDAARAAVWIRRIDEGGTATPEELVAVATVESKLGHRAEAFARLEGVIGAGPVPAWAYQTFASLADDPGARAVALATLAVPAARVPEARRAWVGLAVALDRLQPIQDWIASPALAASDAPALRDAYFLLAEKGRTELSLKAAERLAAVRGTSDDRVLLAGALLAADRPADALKAVRAADRSNADAEAAYVSALYRSILAGEDVAGEVRAVFGARLRAPNVSAERRVMLVEGLLAAGERASIAADVEQLASLELDRWLSPLVESARAAGDTAHAVQLVDAAIRGAGADTGRTELLVRALMDLDASGRVLLPHLKTLAFERGDSWVYAYDERLGREARTDEQVELWYAQGQTPDATVVQRRAAAARLIELKANDRASDVLEDLATVDGPDGPDVQQLLWVWGTRPGDARLRWLLSRLESAPPSDQPGWMVHLTNAGGAALVADAIPVPPPGAGPAYLRAWIDAHRQLADAAQLRQALEAVLAVPEPGLDVLRYAGTTALADGLTDVAGRTFARLLDQTPADPQALRWLGTFAFYAGDTAAAFTHLTTYVAQGGDEPEPLFQLGELWLGRHAPEKARPLYLRALDRLDPSSGAPLNAALRANVLVRLGERAHAVADFEQVLRDEPASRHVRADYVAALLQWGRRAEAGRVLDEGAGIADDRDRDGSGGRRLELLRVQWLNDAGRFGEAWRRLDSLADRFPSDPDVLVAQAGFDQARGRMAEADRQMEAARASAPARGDIARATQELVLEREPRASVSTEHRSIGSEWTTRSDIVTLATGPRQARAFSVTAERQTIAATQVLRADGSIAPLAATLSRVEATATAFVSGGTQVKVSGFGSDGGAGGGATLVHHDLRGAWTVSGEINRPFWDFVEAAAADGRKDRWSLQREWRFRPDTAAWVVADLNRYRIDSGATATSRALTLGFIRTVRSRQPSLTLQYGLDTERVRSATLVTADSGLTFAPIPLVSREVHVFGAVSRTRVRSLGELEASGGYTIDRLGGRGSFLTGHLVPRPAARLGLELWGERRLYSMATTQRAIRLGARGVVRF